MATPRIALLLVLGWAQPGCGSAISWIALDESAAARAPSSPARCERAQLAYEPRRQALLGDKASALWQWASRAFPDNFRVGHSGKLALLPSSSPGVALHAKLKQSKVAFIALQSQASSLASAQPLTREGLSHFLQATTGCDRYVLCQAHTEVEETRFRGHTTCPEATVPLQISTPRHGRRITAVAVWLPSFARGFSDRGRHQQNREPQPDL